MRIGSGDTLRTNFRQAGDHGRLAHIKWYTLPNMIGPDFFDTVDFLVILMIRNEVYQAEQL